MSTSIEGGSSLEINQLIKNYETDPKQHQTDKKKALKKIEGEVEKIAMKVLDLQKQLDIGYAQIQNGKSDINIEIDGIQGEVSQKKEELGKLKLQLAHLEKSIKSRKLADRILTLKISLGDVQGQAKSIKHSVEIDIPKVNSLKNEINTLLRDAYKKSKRKQSGVLLFKAIKKYEELERIMNDMNGDEGYRQVIDSELCAIRARMTTTAERQLPLSKSEKKSYSVYLGKKNPSLRKQKKQELMAMRVAVGNKYFLKSQRISNQNLNISGQPLPSSTGSLLPSEEESLYEVPEGRFKVTASAIKHKVGPMVGRLKQHRLSKKEKTRTKVKVTLYERFRQKDVVRMTKSVHEIGKNQMRILAELTNVQHQYLSGSYDKKVLEKDLEDVQQAIVSTEKQLAELQTHAASKGTSRLTMKVDQAIGANRMLLSAVKEKKAELETVLKDNFAQAAETLKEVKLHVDKAYKEPKNAGFSLFHAFQGLEKLQRIVDSESSEKKIYPHIQEMLKVAEVLTGSAIKEGLLNLTPHKESLSKKLTEINSVKLAKKYLINDQIERRVKRILSKKLTQSLFAPQEKRAELMVEIDEILHLLEKHHRDLNNQVRSSPELKPLLDHYQSYFGDNNRTEAVKFRLEARELLHAISNKDKDYALSLIRPVQNMNVIRNLVGSAVKMDDKKALEMILADLRKGINEKSRLELSGRKLNLKNAMLNGERLDTYKDYQIKRVVVNEMMRTILGKDELVTQKSIESLKHRFGESINLQLSDVFQILDKNGPEISEISGLRELFEIKCIETELEQLITGFTDWAKQEKVQLDTTRMLAEKMKEQFYQTQQNSPADQLLSDNQNDKKILLEAIATKITESSIQNDPQLNSLKNNVLSIMQKLSDQEKTVASVKCLLDSIDDRVDNIPNSQKDSINEKMTKIRSFINGDESLENALAYISLMKPVEEQFGAINTMYVDTFEAGPIRNPPEEIAIDRLVTELERLKSIDSLNASLYDQMIEQVGIYSQAYQTVDDSFKSLYEGPPGGPYNLKDQQHLNDAQVGYVAILEDMHVSVDAELRQMSPEQTIYAPLLQTHIDTLRAAISQRVKNVADLKVLILPQ